MAVVQESSEYSPPWLERYGKNYHTWTFDNINGQSVYRRPLGVVETSFDTDGTEFGGRADMNALFSTEISSSLSKAKLTERIALAWTALRLQHVMLMSRTRTNPSTGIKEFVVDAERSYEDAVTEAAKSIVWVEDLYPEVDSAELYAHCLNVSRIVQPSECMSKMHVLPSIPLPNGNGKLEFLVIMAHQTSDGLSAHNWFAHFLSLLNTPLSSLQSYINASRTAVSIKQRLPPAQEDLYPAIPGNKARQRWFWAVLRILRHKKPSLPPTFTNPLARPTRLPHIPYTPKFSKAFDYSPSDPTRPVLNCGHITASLSPSASARLISLCRSSKLSVGAGCFALAGLAMMELHQERHPDIPEDQRAAFAASFPLNPRAFFATKTEADSCMLAFSEGIVMPFLPKDLPIEGRFKLTAAHANRELKAYQKRGKGKGTGEAGGMLSAHAPGRLLANGYLFQFERNLTKMLAGSSASSLESLRPQGNLPVAVPRYGATCGVSSMGSTAGVVRGGMFELGAVEEGKADFVADYRGFRIGVRARENEFLVGSSTDYRGIVGFGVSYDASAISEEAAEGWKTKVEELLEDGRKAKL